jgi:hypothetical protein
VAPQTAHISVEGEEEPQFEYRHGMEFPGIYISRAFLIISASLSNYVSNLVAMLD